MGKPRGLGSARAVWAGSFSARSAGFVASAAWAKARYDRRHFGCVQTVARDLKTKLWLFLMRIASVSGCHQRADRSFSFRGFQFPLCARCTGILLGQVVALLFLPSSRLSLWYCALILPLAADGLTQFLELRTSTNPLRFLTGILGGYGYMGSFLYLCSLVFGWYTSPV